MHGASLTCIPCSSTFVLPSRTSLRKQTSLSRLKLRIQCEPTSNASTDAEPIDPIDPINPMDPIDIDPIDTIDPTPFKLKPLHFTFDALEPHMSKETVEHHYEKLHRGHVDSLNEIVKGTEFAEMSLMKLVIDSYNKGDPLPFFTHASQVWNHDFFWGSMRPPGGAKPSGRLKYLIERDFGSFENLLNEMKNAALSQFGSGWVWLAYKGSRLGVGNDRNPRPSPKDRRLVVTKTPNTINPLVWGYFPLLAIDVWEHAYYMDYENRKGDYVLTVLDKLVWWDKVGFRLETLIKDMGEKKRKQMEELLRKKEIQDKFKARKRSPIIVPTRARLRKRGRR
ncbi:hypothetical protein LUZ60_014154 [Juncus effusus]|nr:hypothetical protein LUZ60_014154 [Juncus effusus]